MRLPAAVFALVLAFVPQAPQLPIVKLPPLQSLQEWLTELRAEALAKGISEATLSRALDCLEPPPVVI